MIKFGYFARHKFTNLKTEWKQQKMQMDSKFAVSNKHAYQEQHWETKLTKTEG